MEPFQGVYFLPFWTANSHSIHQFWVTLNNWDDEKQKRQGANRTEDASHIDLCSLVIVYRGFPSRPKALRKLHVNGRIISKVVQLPGPQWASNPGLVYTNLCALSFVPTATVCSQSETVFPPADFMQVQTNLWDWKCSYATGNNFMWVWTNLCDRQSSFIAGNDSMRVWTNLCDRESFLVTNCWQELNFEFSRQS